jgi:hypothetical protein
MANNCNKKIRETLYTLLFGDFDTYSQRKFKRFPPAIVPIPVRTRKINPKFFLFSNNCSGGTHPVSSSIVKRPYRYCEDFGRDPPAICRLRERFFHNYDFETVLPVSKTTAVGNLLDTICTESHPL